MMKYKVAVQWMMTAEVEVEAESLTQAMAQVRKDTRELPEGSYLDDSLEVNSYLTCELNS
jgi:hypothetical protein